MEGQSTKPWYTPIVDWLKLNGGDLILDNILKYATQAIAGIGGFYGWALKVVLKYVIIPFIRHAKQHIKRVKDGNVELDKLTEVTNDPTKTNTEVIAAEDDFFTRP